MRYRSIVSLVLLSLSSCAGVPADQSSAYESRGLFELLDAGGDGTLSPFEALDVLLMISEDGALNQESLEGFLAQHAEEELAEERDFFEMGDPDQDGVILLDELPSGFVSMVSSLDTDGDGSLSWEEYREGDLRASELMARGEGAELYAELVDEVGEPVRLDGAPRYIQEELRELDLDGDRVVTLEETVQLIRGELEGASFEVKGELAVMRGVINETTPPRVLELAFMHPGVRTIVLASVPGSIDDVANMRAGRYIRQLGLGTHVPADGEVASGGTDLFLAGEHRSAERGARFGIHSWSGGPVPATELPKDHEEHRLYLDFYEEMGIPADFYWRTLSAAPPEGIHWMTEGELEGFNFFTEEGSALRPELDLRKSTD